MGKGIYKGSVKGMGSTVNQNRDPSPKRSEVLKWWILMYTQPDWYFVLYNPDFLIYGYLGPFRSMIWGTYALIKRHGAARRWQDLETLFQLLW